MIETNLCPRCSGPIPNAARPGAYPGALSRTDNATEICSGCGMMEALEDCGLAPATPDVIAWWSRSTALSRRWTRRRATRRSRW